MTAPTVTRRTILGDVHDDWLERLICRTGYRWAEGDFEPWRDPRCEKTVRYAVDHTPSGQPIRFARNYVIFAAAPPETLVLANPPLVTVHGRRLGIAEEWLADNSASELRELVLGVAKNPNRGLRSSPTGYAQSPLQLTMSATPWRKQMLELIERHDLETR